jgi:hypothetical protein
MSAWVLFYMFVLLIAKQVTIEFLLYCRPLIQLQLLFPLNHLISLVPLELEEKSEELELSSFDSKSSL